MATNIREQIVQALADLRGERLRSFRSTLAQLSRGAGDIDYLSPNLRDEATRALQTSISETVTESAFRVLKISRAPSAFALMEQEANSVLLELAQLLQSWFQLRMKLPIAALADTGWMPPVHESLRRQLDNYRPEFTAAPENLDGKKGTAGRPQKYDWAAATNAVWGRIYRGELIPEMVTQADIEVALLEYFEVADASPSESIVRTHASRIYQEALREA